MLYQYTNFIPFLCLQNSYKSKNTYVILKQFHMLLQNTKVKTHMLYQYTNFIQFLFTHFLPISCQKLSIIHTRIMPLEYQNNSNLEILIVISLINNIPNSLHYYFQNSLQYNAKKKSNQTKNRTKTLSIVIHAW